MHSKLPRPRSITVQSSRPCPPDAKSWTRSRKRLYGYNVSMSTIHNLRSIASFVTEHVYIFALSHVGSCSCCHQAALNQKLGSLARPVGLELTVPYQIQINMLLFPSSESTYPGLSTTFTHVRFGLVCLVGNLNLGKRRGSQELRPASATKNRCAG